MNYYDDWISRREKHPLKLDNKEILKVFIDKLPKDVKHMDSFKKDNSLYFTEGSPNFSLFKIAKYGHYITNNPLFNMYKDYYVDEKAIDILQHKSNNKYTQPLELFISSRSYDLHLLQMISKDYKYILDSLAYSTHSKKYTIFKLHPCPPDSNSYLPNLLNKARSLNILSEYTKFLHKVDTTTLINNAERVYSYDSGGVFYAQLLGKPCATYSFTDHSEITPIITTAKQLDDLLPTPDSKRLKFLSWYYNKLCIDTEDIDFANKIVKIVNRYNKYDCTIKVFS